jgi:hypothetical protein
VRWGLVFGACALTAVPALRGVDEAMADEVWRSSELAVGDARGPLRVAAAGWASRVAPWQHGWSTARARVRAVAQERRAALADDRGGRRVGPPNAPPAP